MRESNRATEPERASTCLRVREGGVGGRCGREVWEGVTSKSFRIWSYVDNYRALFVQYRALFLYYMALFVQYRALFV